MKNISKNEKFSVDDISRLVDYMLVKDGLVDPLPALPEFTEINNNAVIKLKNRYNRDKEFKKIVNIDYSILKSSYMEVRTA